MESSESGGVRRSSAMRRTLGLIVVLGLAAGAAQAQKKDREPTVNGKTVAAWVKVLEGKEALPRLQAIKALEDDDSAVRIEAAASLWKVAEEKRGLDVLVKSLDDKSASVVQTAIAALGEMGAEAKTAADALKKVAEKDKEPARRIQAAEA